jgi:capsular exopolysaccharide synthesis family protein
MSEIFSWLRNPIAFGAEIDEPEPKIAASPGRLFGPLRPTAPVRKSTAVLQLDISSADPMLGYMLDQNSFGGEQYRLLRANFLLQQKERALKKILITSAVPGEGKTFTSCSLAGILAQEPGKRVVLIDADLRRPRAAQVLGCSDADNLAGLCHVLRGEVALEEALLKISGMELYLMPSGGRPKNPAELLSSPNLESAFRTLSESFDWIIIDSPPVLALADSILLASIADFTLLVVRSGFTPSKVIQEAIQRLNKERIGGIALNRVRQSEYSRYYHTYYSGNGAAGSDV